MNKIILLSGWKGSGKDSFAKFLCEDFGYNRIAFADKLKDSIALEYNLKRSIFDDRTEKEKPLFNLPVSPKDESSVRLIEIIRDELRLESGLKPNEKTPLSDLFWTPRALCVFEGSVKRAVDPQFWIKKAIKDLSLKENYVISDARYKSEIDCVKSTMKDHKIITVRVNRNITIDTNDSSERDLDQYNFDIIINNNEGLEFLKREASRINHMI